MRFCGSSNKKALFPPDFWRLKCAMVIADGHRRWKPPMAGSAETQKSRILDFCAFHRRQYIKPSPVSITDGISIDKLFHRAVPSHSSIASKIRWKQGLTHAHAHVVLYNSFTKCTLGNTVENDNGPEHIHSELVPYAYMLLV